MLDVGTQVVMVNRAIEGDAGVQVRVLEADAGRMVVTTVFGGQPKRYVFTRRINGFWVQQGFPTAVGWGRALLVFEAVAR